MQKLQNNPDPNTTQQGFFLDLINHPIFIVTNRKKVTKDFVNTIITTVYTTPNWYKLTKEDYTYIKTQLYPATLEYHKTENVTYYSIRNKELLFSIPTSDPIGLTVYLDS